MKVIHIDALNRKVEGIEIDGSLESMQKLVDGLIKPICIGKNGLFVNEEGSMLYRYGFMYMLNGQRIQLYGSGFICSVNLRTGEGSDYDNQDSIESIKKYTVFWQHAESDILKS